MTTYLVLLTNHVHVLSLIELGHAVDDLGQCRGLDVDHHGRAVDQPAHPVGRHLCQVEADHHLLGHLAGHLRGLDGH